MNYDIFIADVDFETDLCNGPLKDGLKEYYGDLLSDSSLIKKMKSHKAINIYDFLKNHKERLEALADDYVAKPLLSAKNYIEDKYGTY